MLGSCGVISQEARSGVIVCICEYVSMCVCVCVCVEREKRDDSQRVKDSKSHGGRSCSV
jgi:hypothetical protein